MYSRAPAPPSLAPKRWLERLSVRRLCARRGAKWRWGSLVLAAIGLLLSSTPALSAEEPSVEDVKAAGEQFNLGRTAFKEEDYAVAAEHFERADGLVPNAKVLLLAMQARERAGQIARAAMLAEVAKRRHPGDERFADADAIIRRAAKDHARVAVSCDQPCNLVVGMRLVHGAAATEWVLFLEAGSHEIRAGWGDTDATQQYQATAGEEGALAFREPGDEPPAAPVSETAPQEYDPIEDPFAEQPLQAETTTPDSERKGLSPTWFWIGAGTTVALAGVSTWSAIDTVSNPGQDAVRQGCLGQGEDCTLYQDGVSRQNRTNLLWGLTAGAGVVTVVLLTLTDFGDGNTREGEYSDQLAFAPFVGDDAVGALARGRF